MHITAPSLDKRVSAAFPGLQVTKYVEREIVNHRSLLHPHIVSVWLLLPAKAG
jgi:hypothetical protein